MHLQDVLLETQPSHFNDLSILFTVYAIVHGLSEAGPLVMGVHWATRLRQELQDYDERIRDRICATIVQKPGLMQEILAIT